METLENWLIKFDDISKSNITELLNLWDNYNFLIQDLLEYIVKHAPEALIDENMCVNVFANYFTLIIYGISNYCELEDIYDDPFTVIINKSKKITVVSLIIDVIIIEYENTEQLKLIFSNLILGTVYNGEYQDLYKLILEIIEDTPIMIKYFIDIFKNKIVPNKQTKELTLDNLLEIESNNGNLIIKSFSTYLFKNDDVKVNIEFGACLQYLKDIINYHNNSKKNIYTIVNFVINTGELKNADKILDIIIKMVEDMPNKYCVYKIYICLIVVILISKYEIFSETLKNKVLIFLPFKVRNNNFIMDIYEHILHNIRFLK